MRLKMCSHRNISAVSIAPTIKNAVAIVCTEDFRQAQLIAADGDAECGCDTEEGEDGEYDLYRPE